jgi:hypothetical protein
MKHPSSRAFFAIWDKSRAGERAPYRSDLPPETMRELLGDIFVLSYDSDAGYPLRVAGTRVCALLGGDRKGDSLPALFEPASRRDLTDIVGEVAEELLVAVAGVDAVGADGGAVSLELLLLPFRSRAHTPLSLIGLLVSLTPARAPLRQLTLTSWRYVGHQRERFAPRALRKLALARGLVVYEGLR